MADDNPQYFATRLAFVKAMKESPEYPDVHSGKGDADLNVGLEVVGIHIAHNTITKMVAEGTLDKKIGIYLNATIASNAFCCLHACTHGGVAMGKCVIICSLILQHFAAHTDFLHFVFSCLAVLTTSLSKRWCSGQLHPLPISMMAILKLIRCIIVAPTTQVCSHAEYASQT